jgi:uncharacterized protein
MEQAAPVLQKERINIIDSLRGVAILGILLMNIPGFSSAGDPFIRNEFGTVDYKVWYYVSWIADGRETDIVKEPSLITNAPMLEIVAA